MEEKLSDNICKDAFREYYVKKDYSKSLSKGKRIYRLLLKIDKQNMDYKDNFYMWMILMIIIKSYKNLNQIDKSFKYIMLSLRLSTESYKRIENYKSLVEYYSKIGNNEKCMYYLNKYVESCNNIGKYQTLSKLFETI